MTTAHFAIGPPYFGFIPAIETMFFVLLLVGLAVLDAEYLWIANAATIPGTILGLSIPIFFESIMRTRPGLHSQFWIDFGGRLIATIAAGGIILLIRWTYWLIRRREGIGLGDAKLMAMLGAWLGLSGALLSFAIGVLLGAVFALVVLAVPAARRESDNWLLSKMPLGTFLCVGGIVSALWGQPMIAAYLRLIGVR
jgi:leader peptidase (prepilin peptidase)/N-methyltransferase